MNNIFITYQAHTWTRNDSTETDGHKHNGNGNGCNDNRNGKTLQWELANNEIIDQISNPPVRFNEIKDQTKATIKPLKKPDFFSFFFNSKRNQLEFIFFRRGSCCCVQCECNHTQWMCNIHNHDLWSSYRLLGWLQRLDCFDAVVIVALVYVIINFCFCCCCCRCRLSRCYYCCCCCFC